MLEGKFKVEVIAQGQFEDCGLLIHTTVIRLNPDAMNEWLDSDTWNDRSCYVREEAWQAYKEKTEADREEVKKQNRKGSGNPEHRRRLHGYTECFGNIYSH